MEDKIKELEKQIAELKAELENKKENKGKWIPKENEHYYFVNNNLATFGCINKCDTVDELILKYNKIFPTRKQAQRYAEYLKARHEYSYEFSRKEWGNNRIFKYYIYYSFISKEIAINFVLNTKYINEIYFDSKEKAQEFIDKYRKEILEFEFGIVEE